MEETEEITETKPRPRRVWRYALGAVLLLVVLAVAAVSVGWRRVNAPYRGFSAAEVFVDVPAGSGPASIGQRLVDAGVIRDALTFRAALWASGNARALQAGEYRFDQAASPLDVLSRLARGDVYRRAITFREGLTVAEMAVVFEQAGFGSAADFRQAALNTALIRQWDTVATDLEGYLFPDTYTLARGTTASALVANMVASFGEVMTPALRERWSAHDLTVRQALTVAALVEKETAVPAERPQVAAVYLNRRRINMPMQADPTVIFALQRAGRYDGNLRRDDLQFDSPYNTYRYPGLPPGPIAAPGRASLEAVGQPAAVPYLYFVSRNDGSHVFAATLDEHNRNVQQWQVEYFRQRREGSRR